MYSSSATTGDFENFIARDVVSYIDDGERMNLDRRSFAKSLTGVVGSLVGGRTFITARTERTPASLARAQARLSASLSRRSSRSGKESGRTATG
jgi:hypothetical protein